MTIADKKKNKNQNANLKIDSLTKKMIELTANSCVDSMGILNSSGESPAIWHLPYYLLAATSLELLPKTVLIDKRQKAGDSTENAKKYLKKYKHDLEKIYSDPQLDMFKMRANIQKVEKVASTNNFRYEFFITNKIDPIIVYDIETIRYHLLSGKPNSTFLAHQFDDILKLCISVCGSMKIELI